MIPSPKTRWHSVLMNVKSSPFLLWLACPCVISGRSIFSLANSRFNNTDNGTVWWSPLFDNIAIPFPRINRFFFLFQFFPFNHNFINKNLKTKTSFIWFHPIQSIQIRRNPTHTKSQNEETKNQITDKYTSHHKQQKNIDNFNDQSKREQLYQCQTQSKTGESIQTRSSP